MDNQINKKTCKNCGNPIFDSDEFCGHCGYKIQNTEAITAKTKRKKWLFLTGGFALLAVAAVIVLTTVCFHNWQPATCTQSSVCSKCNKVKGEPKGHSWMEATCTEKKKCKNCSLAIGDPLGHNFSSWTTTKEPSCTSTGSKEGVCTVCKKTETKEIEAKGHTAGNWTIDTAASVTSSGKKIQRCTVCSTIIDSKSYSLTSFVSNGKFMFTPNDFTTIINKKSLLISSTISGDENGVTCAVLYNKELTAVVTFVESSETLIPYNKRLTTNPKSIMCAFNASADDSSLAETMRAIVKSCDPSLSSDEAGDLLASLVLKYQDNPNTAYTYKNGLKYTLTTLSNVMVMTIAVS